LHKKFLMLDCYFLARISGIIVRFLIHFVEIDGDNCWKHLWICLQEFSNVGLALCLQELVVSVVIVCEFC
jgi:hypothetical protein